ncbi:band 7 protein AGAP004871-like isoform X2 [Halichondria panicea]|uniref:band 7 protein AGAP004871-like isoform X2 n=1 Tax=Halichondria panicea TaxID=6063 RepID=UPI00312BAFF5
MQRSSLPNTINKPIYLPENTPRRVWELDSAMASQEIVEIDVALKPKRSQQDSIGDMTDDVDVGGGGGCSIVLAVISFIIVIFTFPFSLIYTVKIVKEYERAVILRLGRLTGRRAKGPGLFFVLPCIDTVQVVDLRTVTLDVPPQEILTKDSVTAKVDAVVYFRIADPIAAILKAENAKDSTYRISQSTLRDVLGTRTLAEILAERDVISEQLGTLLDIATDRWGVKVLRVEMKDVTLPTSMQRSMAAEAEADREARAKVVSAEGEQRAARKLREAADVLDESPAALQLRYLQTLNTISAENNHTYVFPLPIDLLAKMLSK